MTTVRAVIAIDVDDVLADTQHAVRTWAHQMSGVELAAEHYHTKDPYWNYYNSIWDRHSLEHLRMEAFLKECEHDQAFLPPVDGAKQALTALSEHFDIVYITSRLPELKNATRRWLDEYMLASAPLYLAANPLGNEVARSKGELCIELGASFLIDDNIDNCQSAADYGVQPVLFGYYGWNDEAPENLERCKDWPAVRKFIDARR